MTKRQPLALVNMSLLSYNKAWLNPLSCMSSENMRLQMAAVPLPIGLEGLRDRRARARVGARLARARLGNLGDYRSLGEGVYELRIFYGPGYRVYVGFASHTMVLLLIGGTKAT